jgi:D-alanyl-D-alanine carboxypeptidase/D-alanyl-D-alanine-endopeptidase (penicillin-binding protein 4)
LSPLEALRHSIDSLASNPIFSNSNMGILVVNPQSGDTLFSRNAGKLFMPASNQKILTASVALALLGPDYRYKTSFVTTGTVQNGVLNGDVVVIGRGDPTVSNRAQQGNAMSWMLRVADSLTAHGINRISGALRRGGNAFPDSIYGYGWEWDDLSTDSGAPVDELLYDEGMTTARVQINGRDTVVEIATRTPGRTYLEALDSALSIRGIVVGRGISDSVAMLSPDPAPLFVVQSPPLRDILRLLEKPSQNQIAEILLHTIGLERTGVGTADSGAAVVSRQLAAWGAQPRQGFVMYDGSGLSRHDLVSPETIVRVLVAIEKDTAFQAFYDALPVAGVDGTLRTRMLGTPAAGNMHAKTGTLQFVRSLSGYVTDADGDRLVFSLLHNHFTVPVDSVTRFQDQIGALLANYHGKRR